MLKEFSEKIATYTSRIIDHDVIITDEKSIIIGASDKSRIGTFHEASVSVIATNKTFSREMTVLKHLDGTKIGVTIPLTLSNKVIGSIGITGNPKEVNKYCLLLKAYVETLLLSELSVKSKYLREKAVESLVQEISAFDTQSNDENIMIMHGYKLGYDLTCPRLAIAIHILSKEYDISKKRMKSLIDKEPIYVYSQSVKSDIIHVIKNSFRNPNDISVQIANDKFIVLMALKSVSDNESIYKIAHMNCSSILKELAKNNIDATILIGPATNSIPQMKHAMDNCLEAVEIGEKLYANTKILNINSLYLENLLAKISKKTCRQFIQTTLASIHAEPDSEDLSKTICAWCESGFSMTKTSKILNIHRNTLAYRMNKIQDITGFDLKIFKNALRLYLAICSENIFNVTQME